MKIMGLYRIEVDVADWDFEDGTVDYLIWHKPDATPEYLELLSKASELEKFEADLLRQIKEMNAPDDDDYEYQVWREKQLEG